MFASSFRLVFGTKSGIIGRSGVTVFSLNQRIIDMNTDQIKQLCQVQPMSRYGRWLRGIRQTSNLILRMACYFGISREWTEKTLFNILEANFLPQTNRRYIKFLTQEGYVTVVSYLWSQFQPEALVSVAQGSVGQHIASGDLKYWSYYSKTIMICLETLSFQEMDIFAKSVLLNPSFDEQKQYSRYVFRWTTNDMSAESKEEKRLLLSNFLNLEFPLMRALIMVDLKLWRADSSADSRYKEFIEEYIMQKVFDGEQRNLLRLLFSNSMKGA